MSKTYNFGPDTDYSVEVILNDLGYDTELLREMNADDRFDFTVSIVPEVKVWFADRREKVEAPRTVRSILHALSVEVPHE